MNDDTKQMGIAALGLALLLALGVFGGLRCQSQQQETLRQCLQTQRPALECAALFNGGNR